MRPGFREGMEQYGEVAKDDLAARRKIEELSQQEDVQESDILEVAKEAEGVENALTWELQKRMRKTGTAEEVQKEIYALQRDKQAIMLQLKESIEALDDPEAKESAPKRARNVVMKNGRLHTSDDKGESHVVTIGALITDGAWGIEYALDKATVPRVLRKRLLVERARRQLEDLLDGQILLEEIGRDKAHEGEQEAYRAIAERRDAGREHEPFGITAERIVAQTVRLMIMDEGRPYKYEHANVFQDVRKKIDFVIRSTDYGRGVKVDADESGSEEIERKGMQMTITRDTATIQRKKAQVANSRARLSKSDGIDDIALMQVDAGPLGRAYNRWKESGRPPGGPDRFLPAEFRERLFAEMTKGMGGAEADDRETKMAA